MTPRARAERWLDVLARPTVRTPAGTASSFHVCGVTGYLAAVALALTLAAHRGLDPRVVLALAAAGAFTFVAQAMVRKMLTGVEKLTFYYDLVAVTASSLLVLRLLDAPVLPYLDGTVLGVGAFLVCGRVGCHMVGCCHGRPHGWGVCYRPEHADAGFPAHFVGVRLFPVQLTESAVVAVVVAASTAHLLAGAPPGTGVATFVAAYGMGRFFLEPVRGDADRRYWLGFSEAQWTSHVLPWSVVAAEYLGLLPFTAWHVAAAALLLGMTLALAAYWTVVDRSAALLRARHVDEIARHLRRSVSSPAPAAGGVLPDESTAPQVARTSLGLRLSAGRVRHPGGWAEHHALSLGPAPLGERTAWRLARAVARLRGAPGADAELVRGREGVYHLLIHDAPAGAEPRGAAAPPMGA